MRARKITYYGPEFISLHLYQWAYWTKVKLAFSRPGRPSDNAFCESFNNHARQELLNTNYFLHSRLRTQAAAWRIDYNTNHPHSSLGDLAPEEFAKRTKNLHHKLTLTHVLRPRKTCVFGELPLLKGRFAVKTSRFSDEQIAYALRNAEAGTPAAKIVRKLGISEQLQLTSTCNVP